MPPVLPRTKFFNNLPWRSKAAGFLAASAILFVGLVFATQRWIVLPRIQSAEFSYYGRIGEEVIRNVQVRQRVLGSLAETLAGRNVFGAPTDDDLRDALASVGNADQGQSLKLAFVAVFGGDGRAKEVWRPTTGLRIASSIFGPVVGAGATSSGAGELSTVGGMLVYAKIPYQKVGASGAQGTLVVAEFLSRPPVGDISDLGPVRSAFVEDAVVKQLRSGSDEISPDCVVYPDGDTTMVTLIRLRDDTGRPVGGIEIRSERLVRLVQITSMRLTVVVMLIATIILSLVIWILVERLYVRRIERLIDLAGRLDEGDAIDALVHFQGNDEVGRLARTTGHMVRTLNEARELAVVADTAKMNFLAMMSHELRTPMNGVIGFAGLLRETPINAEQIEYVRIIESSGRAILKQIDEILHYAMISQGVLSLDVKPVKIRDLISEAGRALEQELAQKQLSLQVKVDESVPRIVWLDRERVGQVLAHLLSNAVKFTSTGGVSVEVKVTAEGESGERQLEINVVDTGIGITSEHQMRLFRPFSQAESGMNRRYGGAGLGLAIAHRLVQAMGGDITVVSAVGKGSTFTALLPLKESESYPAARVALSGGA